MKPIPVEFHIGPLPIHTYGIGLAITFWFAYRYFARRLRDNGFPDEWLGGAFIWIIVSAILGARALHVIANWGFYSVHPSEILAIWNGGLSSFGGLLFAVPVGLVYARKRCPELPLGRCVDLVSPVLVVAWAVGRLLGPQMMVAGGGKPTNAWYGMYYAGQVGKRLPVPLFQAVECFVIYLIVLQIEKWAHSHGDRPVGLVTAGAVTLWGLSRFVDERFWLTHDNGTDAVEAASIAFVVAGIGFMTWLVVRGRRHGWPESAAVAVGAAGEGGGTEEPTQGSGSAPLEGAPAESEDLPGTEDAGRFRPQLPLDDAGTVGAGPYPRMPVDDTQAVEAERSHPG